nr:MAG TPA: hypothetical protein [Bacteriophage sp.]
MREPEVILTSSQAAHVEWWWAVRHISILEGKTI